MTTFEADDEREGRIAVVTKGAPDVLLTRCTHERIAGEIRPLTDDRRGEMLETVDRLADLAFRTLARRLPAAPRYRATAPARVDRARARLPRDGRHHRPAPPRGPDGDRRGPGGRDQDHHDHRRPPPHRGPHRPRPRHHRSRLDGADRRRHRDPRRGRAARGRPQTSRCTPGSHPSTSCASSPPSKPTATSSP